MPAALHPVRITLLLSLLASLPAHASVRCQIDGQNLAVAEARADFNYSPSGAKGFSGHVSLFRLMAADNGDGPSSSIELKTTDVAGPGSHALSTQSLWRSVIRVRDDDQKVTVGRFVFSRFEVSGHRGRAVGRVEFRTGKSSGDCHFDIEVQAIDRDRIANAVK